MLTGLTHLTHKDHPTFRGDPGGSPLPGLIQKIMGKGSWAEVLGPVLVEFLTAGVEGKTEANNPLDEIFAPDGTKLEIDPNSEAGKQIIEILNQKGK